MPSTYSSNLKIELMSTGENSGTWGNITNTNLGTALEQAVVGYGAVSYASDANLTISITNSNAAQAARALVLNVTSAVSLTGTRELVVPTIQKQYIVQNNTTGSQSITVKTSAGTGITVPNGRKAHLYVNGTDVIQMFDFVDINGGAIDGTPIGASSASTGAFTTLNASGATTLDGNVTLGNASGDNVTVTGTITSNLLFTDNTYDIGASGATRPRNLFLAGAATIGGNLSVGGTLTLTGGVNLNGNVTVGDNSSDTLTINSTITSNLLFTDNTYDIGASGATRPRNLFLAGNATIGGNQTLTGSLTVDSTTDSSSTTTGSIQTDGGLGVAKALYVGTNVNIGGLTPSKGMFTDASKNLTSTGTLGTDQGGTGLTSFTANGVVYASSTSALTTSSALTFNGNLSSTGGATFQGGPTGFSGGEVRLGPATANLQNAITTQSTGTPELFFDHRALNNAGQFAWRIGTNGATELARLNSNGLGLRMSPDNGVLTILKDSQYNNESSAAICINSAAVGGVTELLLGADQASNVAYVQSVSKSTSYSTKYLSLNPNGGNVGIRTIAPAYALDVNGTGNFVGNLTGTTASFSSYVVMSSLVVNDPGSGYYAFTSRMGGSLGISGTLAVGTASGNVPASTSITSVGAMCLGAGTTTTGDYLSSGGGNSSTYNGIAILSNSRGIATQANTGLPSWILDVGGRAADGSTYNVNTSNKFRVAYVAAGGSYYSASNFFTINSSGFVGINQINPTTRLAVTLDTNDAASITSYSDTAGAIAANQGEIRELGFNVTSGSNFVISSIGTSASGWRVVFRGTWSNNVEGGGLSFYAPYIELNAANPSTSIGSTTFTVSRNGSGFLIANCGSASRITFAGTVEIYENPQSQQPSQSMRLLGGIQFPATQNASSNANTLDDYEEGTYVVTFTPDTSGSITLNGSFNELSYIKIGSQVTIFGRVLISSVSSPVGSIRISMPFTPETGLADQSDYYAMPMFTHDVDLSAGTLSVFGESSGTNYWTIYQTLDNAAWTALPAANLKGNGNEYFYITGSYRAA